MRWTVLDGCMQASSCPIATARPDQHLNQSSLVDGLLVLACRTGECLVARGGKCVYHSSPPYLIVVCGPSQHYGSGSGCLAQPDGHCGSAVTLDGGLHSPGNVNDLFPHPPISPRATGSPLLAAPGYQSLASPVPVGCRPRTGSWCWATGASGVTRTALPPTCRSLTMDTAIQDQL